ncbi:uncharacterized protein LOC110270918 isoform X2 [Arachis ipaensis]|uniref:uncharacterized protein LOC110270918 isoform X2 n=1 Tax=Arachis ipaensis TaxID=130454 RepID=UPI000A2AFC6D|nr:uncharacterized protein LOC110270918 isoform X2 [Arachis ipaensis]
MVLARINDNWRRYKTTIKQTHFLPYKCVNVMLKNCPKSIPESHFRKLIAYWRTEKVKAHLQAENKKSKESAIRAFQSIFGKEKAGRMRCHRRVTTPTLLKKNEEIATLKQQHATEKATLEGKVDVMQKEVDELKSLVKMMLQKKKSSGVDLDMLAAQLGSTLGNPNNDAHEEENYVEGEIELD